MRGFIPFIFGGVLAVLAMDMAAPVMGVGMAVTAWPSLAAPVDRIEVNRSSKGDRLPASETTVQKPGTPERQPVLVGCEPAFSPLSASARLNYAGRCMAALTSANPA